MNYDNRNQFLVEPEDSKYDYIKSNEYIHVHSCGLTVAKNSFDFSRENGSPDYMLNLVSAGSLYYNSKNSADKKILAERGTIIIYRPGESQFLTSPTKNMVRYWVHFTGYGTENLLNECGLFENRFYYATNVEILEKIILKILDELQSNRKIKNIRSAAYLMELLSEIGRQSANEQNQSNALKQLTPAINYINTQYNQKITIDMLADMCYLSKYHFIKLFKKHTGLTPYVYLNNVRINIAKDLLENSTIKIQDIPELIGIHDLSYFSKIFKNHENISPSGYRNNKISQLIQPQDDNTKYAIND